MNELGLTHERGEYIPVDDESTGMDGRTYVNDGSQRMPDGSGSPQNNAAYQDPQYLLDELDLFQQEKVVYQSLEDAVNEMSEAGMQLASDNAEYYKLKAQSMAMLRGNGVPVTAARETIKGDGAVNDALLMRDMSEVRYKSAYELINVLKLKYRFVTEQIQREWTRPSNR